MRAECLDRPPQRRGREGRAGEARVGEGEHTALTATLDRDEVAGSRGERTQRLALPQPRQRGRLRSRGQKVSGLGPQRLQVDGPEVRVERVEPIIDADVVAHVATLLLQSVTGLRIVPISLISDTMISPACTSPTPGGAPVRMTSPGSRRITVDV